jgi:DNA-binding transcriptional LysR family regulator
MRFDLTDLRLFLHVAEAENITRGAERAGMALASARERIRGMELAGGVSLFERRPRGVRLTPAGEAESHHARVVLNQLDQMRGELTEYARGLRGHVRVLANTASLAEFLPGTLAAFLASHPEIDVDLEERPSRDIIDAVVGGFADLGIVADTVELGDLDALPFRIDELLLIAPIGHPLADRKDVAFRDTLDEAFVGLSHGSALQTHLAGHAARSGRSLKLRVRLGGFEAVCRTVTSGVGIAIVPREAARRYGKTELSMIPLTDPWASRRLLIVVRNISSLPAHARNLVDHLTEKDSTKIDKK